jgi:hypothetical protein
MKGVDYEYKEWISFSFILRGGADQHVDWEQVKRWSPAQGILWLHLDYLDERIKKWLFEESGFATHYKRMPNIRFNQDKTARGAL